MDHYNLTITLQELVDSGCLSRCVFSAFGNNENDASNHVIHHNTGSSSTSSSLHSLNAVKISLLLATDFARCDSTEEGNTSLSSVQLEHVHVKLSSSRPIQNSGACSEPNHFGHNTFGGDKEHKEDTAIHDITSSKSWTILGMTIVSPPLVSEQLPRNDDKNVSSIRHLGELIYAIFSNDKKIPFPSAENSPTPTLKSDEEGRTTTRRKKINDETSLFSNLVETGDYPVSVCRLLSDMIDTSIDNGKADSPFSSFDEVIDDLTHMSLHPCIFLYDAGVSFTLAFGQRCYGQKEELSRLLSISTGLEHSAVARATCRSEVVFVTGVAGVGKTLICQRLGDFLSNLGNWIVVKTKFERGNGVMHSHRSRQFIASLFDMLLNKIVEMRCGDNDADVDYSRRATKAITDAIDQASLTTLARFLPNIGELIPGIDRNKTVLPEAELKSWQMAYLLSKLMSAVLSLDRFIMLCLDDLQWCDPVMLALMTEIIIHSGQQKRGCLFFGAYRSNEVSGIHPLKAHRNGLIASKHVNVTEMQLSSLSENDVIEMLMTEMRLPRRLVMGLGATVHKKTSGHALFVVQLLTSLVRDAMITYSPRKLRYDFDRDRLSSIKTWENVASLIVSNLSSLSTVDLQNLRVLCCFGMQSHISILNLIKDCPTVQSGGVVSSLHRLIESGILERAGSVVSFSHDLIHDAIYENMTLEHRQYIQFNIGTFLGTKASLDTADVLIEAKVEQPHLSHDKPDGPQTTPSSLIAVDLINNAGPEYVKGRPQRLRFATWNLKAAAEAKANSNFQSTLHYCRIGIAFLGAGPWSNDSLQLCQELHEEAAFSSYAIGKTTDTTHFSNMIVTNVAFEQGLFAQFMILRSLETAGRHEETIARGLALLRTLKLNIPTNPTPSTVLKTMIQTGQMASKYSTEQIVDMQKSTKVDSMNRNILNLVEAVSVACYRTASSYYPLVACSILSYSLKNRIICEEAAAAFAIFGYFKIFLQGEYDAGKHLGSVAEKMLNPIQPKVRAGFILNGFLFLWFKPLDDLSEKLFGLYEIGIKVGDTDAAMHCLSQYWRTSFYGGQKLSTLSLSYNKFMKLMVKCVNDAAKFSVLEIALTNELTGNSQDPYSYFEGSIKNEAELFMYARENDNRTLLQSIAFKRFVSAFYFGDYEKASILSNEVLSFPTSKSPRIQLIFHYFYHGLIAFSLYREGKGEHYLDEGNKTIEKMRVWEPNSPHTFGNKLLLLEAEYQACLGDRDASIEKYESSISVAQDNGFIHEQGLAYEFMGHYLSSITKLPESIKCYKQAHGCYTQWGAVAKARKIQEMYHLDICDGGIDHMSAKHDRNGCLHHFSI